MEIKQISKTLEADQNESLQKTFNQFNRLLEELRKKELPNKIVSNINEHIDNINSSSASGKTLKKQIDKTLHSILKLLEKELNLVTKNHYRNTWLAIGMAVFGIPIGTAFGVSLGNLAFLSIGLPIGMVLGMALGMNKDKKAFQEGRQIDLEI